MRAWLTLALPLLSVLPGCFLTHGLGRGDDAGAVPADASTGPRDAGVTTDAGACEPVASSVSELVCPVVVAPGAPIVVALTHAPSWCCSEAGSRVRVDARGARSFEIASWWDSCACCELCECLGAPRTERVEIGAFDSGRVTVVAGEHRCEIEVRESECESVSADEVHAPMAVARGDDVPLLLRGNEPHGCGCRPEPGVYPGRDVIGSVGIELCDCSWSDPCVDPGYEVTAVHPGLDLLGTVWIETGDGLAQGIAIVDPATCHAGPQVRALRLAAPDRERLLQSNPIGYWAVLDLEDWYCCREPLSLIETAPSPSTFAITLLPRSCVREDCECEPEMPTRWEHWHYLGALAPGEYRVTAGAHEMRFEVTR